MRAARPFLCQGTIQWAMYIKTHSPLPPNRRRGRGLRLGPGPPPPPSPSRTPRPTPTVTGEGHPTAPSGPLFPCPRGWGCGTWTERPPRCARPCGIRRGLAAIPPPPCPSPAHVGCRAGDGHPFLYVHDWHGTRPVGVCCCRASPAQGTLGSGPPASSLPSAESIVPGEWAHYSRLATCGTQRGGGVGAPQVFTMPPPPPVSLGLGSTGTHSHCTGTTGTAAAQEAGARGDGQVDGESAATAPPPPPPPRARSAAAEYHGKLAPDPGPKHGEREGAARQPLPIP